MWGESFPRSMGDVNTHRQHGAASGPGPAALPWTRRGGSGGSEHAGAAGSRMHGPSRVAMSPVPRQREHPRGGRIGTPPRGGDGRSDPGRIHGGTPCRSGRDLYRRLDGAVSVGHAARRGVVASRRSVGWTRSRATCSPSHSRPCAFSPLGSVPWREAAKPGICGSSACLAQSRVFSRSGSCRQRLHHGGGARADQVPNQASSDGTTRSPIRTGVHETRWCLAPRSRPVPACEA